MTDGNTLIVDVVPSGDSYILNDTPVNMMIAYEVVRRHATENGTFYSQLTKKHKTSEGYTFVFDTGDVFESASDTAYPTAESVSDETGGGSGGGVLVVTSTAGTLDKTWQEIVDAMSTTGAVLAHYVDGSIDSLKTFQHASTDGESYYEVKTGTGALNTYEATSASGYPVQQT